MIVRALIAEDEPLARRTLRDFAAEHPWLEVVGEAADGVEAVRLIDELRPDLVFLDVQMPELDGLQVLQRIRHDPEVVFSTAYDTYALEAFELEALDYLVKPFGRERFVAAAERVRRRLAAERPLAPVAGAPLQRVFVRRGDHIVPVRLDEVSRIEAADDYVVIHADGAAHLAHLPLGDLAQRLDAARFRRVHRSHVVNLDYVSSLTQYDARRLLIRMRDGSEVLASRAGSSELRGLIT